MEKQRNMNLNLCNLKKETNFEPEKEKQVARGYLCDNLRQEKGTKPVLSL